MQSQKICTGISSKVLENERRAVFVIPKVYNFLMRKNEYVIENFIWERT